MLETCVQSLVSSSIYLLDIWYTLSLIQLVKVWSNIVMATVSLICCVTEQSTAGLKVDTRVFKMSYLLPPSVKYTLNTVRPRKICISQCIFYISVKKWKDELWSQYFTLINVRNMCAKFGKLKHLSSGHLICTITNSAGQSVVTGKHCHGHCVTDMLCHGAVNNRP